MQLDGCRSRLARAHSGALFTPRSEGFGLPPLEALACGCPALSLARPPCPKFVAKRLYFDPESVKDIAEKIALALSDVTP
jgi:glycosyltransferase involved in cell wall biosynthesis